MCPLKPSWFCRKRELLNTDGRRFFRAVSNLNTWMLSGCVFRCVKGEGEIEKLQAKVMEIRRKLDDTTAAMQELGRENQSLQVSRRMAPNDCNSV